MEIKFDVKMDIKTMYNFLLYYNYTKLQTILGTIIGFLTALIGINQWNTNPRAMLYISFGILLIIYTPVSLYLRAGKQVKLTPIYKKPITYILSDAGITTEQEDASSMMEWDKIEKVVSTNMSIIVFASKLHASILPKASMGEAYESVISQISTHVPPKKVNIK